MYVILFYFYISPFPSFQVWRAELVLSDFVLHKMFTSSEFDGIISLELGAGTGMVAIVTCVDTMSLYNYMFIAKTV